MNSVTPSAPRLYVKSLYKRYLVNALNWYIRRDLWRNKAIEIRAEFERNRWVKACELVGAAKIGAPGTHEEGEYMAGRIGSYEAICDHRQGVEMTRGSTSMFCNSASQVIPTLLSPLSFRCSSLIPFHHTASRSS